MKLFYNVLLLLISFHFLSCTRQDPQVKHTLASDKTNLLLSAAGGNDTVKIHSDIDWKISGIPNWIHTNVTSGIAGDNLLIITVDPNNGLQPLTADIIVTGADVPPVTIKVTQAGTQPFLMTDKTSFSVYAIGEEDSIVITSNVNWSISIPATASWLTADKLSGNAGVTTVYLTSERNLDGQQRDVMIVISSSQQGVQSANISFSQQNIRITSFSPAKGPSRTSVTIQGNFGLNPVVRLNDSICTITYSSLTQITFLTSPYATTGKISVHFDTVTLVSATDFTVTNTWVKVLDAGYSGLGGSIQDGISFVFGNKIYFGFGTNSSAINTSGFRIYDPASDQWSQGPVQPLNMGGRTDAGCVVVNGEAYIGFGRYFNFYSDYWSLDPATGTWRQLTDYPNATGIYPLCFENQNTLYAGVPKVDTTLRKFDPLANGGNGIWTSVPVRFPRLQGSLCFTIGNYSYIVGGLDSAGAGTLISNFRFDPINNSLVRVADIPLYIGISQNNAASFVLNNKGYVFCPGNLGTDLYTYDPGNDKWTALGPTFSPDINKVRNNVVVVNSEIYAWDQDGAVYKYIPL